MTSRVDLMSAAEAWVEARRVLCVESGNVFDQARACKDAEAAFRAEADRLAKENEEYRKLLTDPGAVRVNLLRGSIAKPDDLIFMHDSDGPYAHLQARLDRLRKAGEQARSTIASIIRHGEHCNYSVPDLGYTGGKKPASKDMFAFPRHMLPDVDAAQTELAAALTSGREEESNHG